MKIRPLYIGALVAISMATLAAGSAMADGYSVSSSTSTVSNPPPPPPPPPPAQRPTVVNAVRG